MSKFEPNYTRLEAAARNQDTGWIPLYEHIIGDGIVGGITNTDLAGMSEGNESDRNEYFRIYCDFFKKMGYDTVSFECTIGESMPGSGALGRHVDPVIKTREDFEKYPWDTLPDLYFERYGKQFQSLRENMPEGMKAIGGVGNGIFECVQDLVGYLNLCVMSYDDPDLYRDLFAKIGENNLKIWKRFISEFDDVFCVYRFGDDLGFNTSSLISTDDIRELVVPQYRKITDEVHAVGKPFLLHSCGCIFDSMDDIITGANIDAKHSNEDDIAPFPKWVELYGDRIGNFGGIDTDAVCRLSRTEMKEYIGDVVNQCKGKGGFAFGSGNSIPDYVPIDQFIMMNEIIRELRGESN